jgi:hypothetical protein
MTNRREEEKWYAREDSNLWPFAPEANALSRLSYGHTLLTEISIP